MTASIQHPATRRRHSSVWSILTSVLLLAMSTVSFSQAHSQPALSNSLSLEAAVVAPRLDLIALHGEGFTPGGLVQITIASDARSGLDRQLWTVASLGEFGPHGSADPSMGYIPAGTINESVQVHTDVFYGPNGSQDPASGYVDPSPDEGTRARVPLCFQDFTVQAFDVQSGSVSSLVDVNATCSSSAGRPMADAAPDLALAPVCLEPRACELPY